MILQYHFDNSNRRGRRGTQRAENVLDALVFLSGSIKMKNNKGKIWN
jgi:hypothetical protein